MQGSVRIDPAQIVEELDCIFGNSNCLAPVVEPFGHRFVGVVVAHRREPDGQTKKNDGDEAGSVLH